MMMSVLETEMSAFLDSNIVLYALSDEEPKRTRAQQLLGSSPTISTQVVNECSHVLRRKARLTPAQVAKELTLLIGLSRLVDVRMEHIRTAWTLAERYGFSHFDSLIIASALDADCSVLYTEDMQHEQVIDGRLTLCNPFLAESNLPSGGPS
jgi:predicted nucleic acid-binding protein